MKDIVRAAARAAGLVRFGPRGPCKYGHVVERYTINNSCVQCVAEKSKKQEETRVRDPEERKRANKRYYSKPGAMAKQVGRGRVCRAKKPALYRERLKRWRHKNIEKVRSYCQNRRARKFAGGAHSKDEILTLGDRQKWKCAAPKCRKSLRKGYHADHIMPLVKGGTNKITNIQLLCRVCNQRKGPKHPIDWAQENGLLL